MSPSSTDQTRRRYDRIAPFYDMMEATMENGGMGGWRAQLWSMVEGQRVLEVGVGTGRNLRYYPTGANVVAIDLSPAMLERARSWAAREGTAVDLRLMDVEHLDFPDHSFDAVVTTCVFCSVPDPVAGFGEIARVLRPDGRGYLLEHVLSRRAGIRQAMQAANPVLVRVMGANINRETARNLELAGLAIERETDLLFDIMKLFVVRPPVDARAVAPPAYVGSAPVGPKLDPEGR